MINNEYNIDNFFNPTLTYDKISNKIKLGQVVYNKAIKNIEKVDLTTLGEIIQFEKERSREQQYFLLNLTEKWLIKIFDFDSMYLPPQSLTVYTSKKHGLKIHKTRTKFTIAYTIREKTNAGMYKGTHNIKPTVLTVNELMDHLYLIKREEFDFSRDDMDYINAVFLENFN